MDILNLTLLQQLDKIKSKEITSQELVEKSILQIEKYKHKNAILEVFEDAIEQAEKIDTMRDSGFNLPALAGLPIIIKDNIVLGEVFDEEKSSSVRTFDIFVERRIVDGVLGKPAAVVLYRN